MALKVFRSYVCIMHCTKNHTALGLPIYILITITEIATSKLIKESKKVTIMVDDWNIFWKSNVYENWLTLKCLYEIITYFAWISPYFAYTAIFSSYMHINSQILCILFSATFLSLVGGTKILLQNWMPAFISHFLSLAHIFY